MNINDIYLFIKEVLPLITPYVIFLSTMLVAIKKYDKQKWRISKGNKHDNENLTE